MEYVGKYQPLEFVKVVSLYRYPMLFITGIHTSVGRAPSLGRGRAVRCKSVPPQRIRAFRCHPSRNRLLHKMSVFLVGIFGCLFFFLNEIQAQQALFRVQWSGNSLDSVKALNDLPEQFISPEQCREHMQAMQQNLFAKGYLTFNLQTILMNDSLLKAELFLGPQYRFAKIRNGNIPNALLQQLRFDERIYTNQVLNPVILQPFMQKVLDYYENHGYPFAALYLDSLQANSNFISGRIMLDKGPETKIDTILVNEDVKLNRNVLLRQIGLKDGMLYDESRVKTISTRIAEIPYLSEAYPWRIDFNISKTKLNVYLKNKNANRADVLIGLLPNNAEIGGKFLLTGDIKLGLMNALGQGEQIQLNWQNLQYKSPRMNIDFSVPFIFQSAIGISGKFDFYKKDTTFRTVQGELGLIYQLGVQSQLKFYYELSGSRLISVNAAQIVAERKLPANADVSYRTIGGEIILQELDYRLNPRKGYKFLFNAALSFRKFIRNNSIEAIQDPLSGNTMAFLYDSIQLNNNKYRLFTQLMIFRPLAKRLVLAGIYQGGLTFSNNPLYRNELFQIGGYRLLRGFDEGSLFVSQYHVLTVEPRFLLSRNSYLFLFSDLSYIQTKFANNYIADKPYSVGLGMSFETKAGLFNISYAIGGRDSQGLQVRNSKIHFGYVNYF
jgi:outer membrane protein assembly factor BamA